MVGAAAFGPVSAGSSGGWQIVDRPLVKALTQWVDASPMQLTLTLILDGSVTTLNAPPVPHAPGFRLLGATGPIVTQGSITQGSIEAAAAEVNSWQYIQGSGIQPPVLQVKGPIDAPAKALELWALESKHDPFALLEQIAIQWENDPR